MLYLLTFIIQLTGSAPSVSNFASYSGVLIVIVRWGAVFTLCVTTGAGAGVLVELAACSAVGVALGDGVAAGFGAVGGGNKKLQRNKIADDNTSAIKSRFCCISGYFINSLLTSVAYFTGSYPPG